MYTRRWLMCVDVDVDALIFVSMYIHIRATASSSRPSKVSFTFLLFFSNVKPSFQLTYFNAHTTYNLQQSTHLIYTMASYIRDSRSAVRAHRRDSSSSSSSNTNSNRTRPRLLRSSATEPSITASNAIRGSFAGPGSPQRATDLLNRVAVYSPSPEASTPGPVSRHAEPISICRDDREHSPSSSPGTQSVVMVDSPSGYYFSFPSFEEWNRDNQEDMNKDSDD
ncbi:hypothetical protein FOYG_03621 [Fusarium oxysporum NRRL 32931]|uniref:Uncharacterized protein n=1 Tax=Fusarium oxysporum NRRL 32931 TaxID=660029 RepID=W9J499_FUSOX|nr:hypothetical protein FOYG_03621 [Fusarium oxysporum NRRL 32931]